MDQVKRPVLVICSDKSFGAGLSVSAKLGDHFKIIFCHSTPAVLNALQGLRDDTWIFFTFWSSYIPSSIYEKHRAVVFHMTDLPFGRGGTPLQNLIELGYSETKLSAIRCVKEFDAGPIFLKRKLSLRGSASQIFARAERLMPKMIEEIVTRDIVPVSQAGDVVQFRRRTPDMSKLSSAYSPETIYDQIRMVDADGYPRAFIEWGQYRIEFSRVALSNGTVSGAFVMKKGNEN